MNELCELTIYSATEIDDYLLKRNSDFTNTKELARILKQYQIKDTDDALTTNCPMSFYMTLWESIDRKPQNMDELGLEMRLLRADLQSTPNLPNKRLKELRIFLCKLSNQFLSQAPYPPFKLVA